MKINTLDSFIAKNGEFEKEMIEYSEKEVIDLRQLKQGGK